MEAWLGDSLVDAAEQNRAVEHFPTTFRKWTHTEVCVPKQDREIDQQAVNGGDANAAAATDLESLLVFRLCELRWKHATRGRVNAGWSRQAAVSLLV